MVSADSCAWGVGKVEDRVGSVAEAVVVTAEEVREVGVGCGGGLGSGDVSGDARMPSFSRWWSWRVKGRLAREMMPWLSIVREPILGNIVCASESMIREWSWKSVVRLVRSSQASFQISESIRPF